jgi:Fe-S-cluster containining protein
VSARCTACGTCCFSGSSEYVRVDGDDHARLGERADELTVFVGNRAFMRMHDGHCVALTISPHGAFLCGVYEARPATCRELAEGSRECEGELATKGERPGQALLRLRRSRGEGTQ